MPGNGSSSKTAFLQGGGRMGALMRSHDWRRSPLGDPAGWPDALKLAIATCLSSRFPMVVWWGPRLLMLYNDAWQPILGDTKHPAGLGRPGRESWPETWPVVGIQFENALRGIASWFEDLLLASDRHGFLEECYFTYSHSPLRDASGDVVGVLSVVSETTAHVLSDRRQRVLRDLSHATVDATTASHTLADVCRTLVGQLCERNPDVPFAVLYLAEGTRARAIAWAGVDAERFPGAVNLEVEDAWGIARVLRTEAGAEAVIAPSSLADPVPGGVWAEPTTQSVVLPLSRSNLGPNPRGALLIGLNARLRLDAPYSDFLRLVAAQLAAAVSALQLIESERAARAEAERATRLKDDFLATLSHELRTPLSAVIGWARILKKDLSDAAQVSIAVDVIERNAVLQARLITDLLDLSRVASGNILIERQVVPLAGVIEAALDSISPAAASKDIALERSLDPVGRSVSGDPARLQQMLWNLLSNAVKFTPSGGRVGVSLTRVGDQAEIRVTDDGEGIDGEFLPHLFERFRQADASHARRHGGLGLGLALVKQFTELHGGTVRASSEGRGRGATFVIALPLVAAEEPAASTPAGAITGEPSCRAIEGLRVLAIDDHPDALAMVRRILEDQGATVETAADAAGALALAGRGRFDVIVSDIAMPGMDGYDFIVELRRRGIHAPTIALTAFASPDDRIRALAVGFQAHIPKPIDTSALVETIARLAPAVR
ncbi:MAG TPA: hybrid sensor histidine kinase/response regulator [Candidatus Polarisedimenticolia bacterium]|nr:hybrid sensor histidine kinase/response regulator [Candidatus Polarisedimenticolia bacterium]